MKFVAGELEYRKALFPVQLACPVHDDNTQTFKILHIFRSHKQQYSTISFTGIAFKSGIAINLTGVMQCDKRTAPM